MEIDLFARRIKTGILALALAVATTSALAEGAGPDALRGCWLQRKGLQGEIWTTQQWLSREDGAWYAREFVMGPGVPEISANRVEHWELRATSGGFRLCGFDVMFNSLPCHDAFFGRGHAVNSAEAWVEFEVGDKSLRLWLVTADRRSLHFDGVPCGPGS
jgi:hypothetical protein